MSKSKTYYIKTYGCQLNQADSERITTAFEKKGYSLVEKIEEADLVIINSCVVRESAENRVYGLIQKCRMINDKCQIILTGCLAGWALRDKTKKNLKILKEKTKNRAKIILFEDLADFEIKPKRPAEKTVTAYIPISNGCNHFCSYCIVPYARGRERYRTVKEIVNEVTCTMKQGFSEFMLLGQNVNAWKAEASSVRQLTKFAAEIKTFPQLLERIARIKGVKKITFISANPWDFSEELIKVIAGHDNISKEIHLPVQSGSDKILKLMNRGYTAADYLNLIKRIKKRIPEAELTTDILIGFPGETEKDFQKTIELCRRVKFKLAFLNKYSSRPGTAAAKKFQDNIPQKEKKRRWQVLEELINSGLT
ncbi:MAG: MiaB/RimO family radical SAM methylthiotransferase [Patescibacteria group bacterium]